MKAKKYLFRILTLTFLLMIVPIAKEAFGEEKREILFISSYSPNFVTFNNQVDGLKAGLGKTVQLQIEYMDSRTFDSKENEDNFYNLLKYKLSSYNTFDAVIIGDDEALEFAVKYRNELFKNIPMVFLGVSDYTLIGKALELPNISGVNEIESVYENIDLIKKYHKKVKNITFLDRYDDNDRTKKFFKESKEKYPEFNFNSINTRKISSKKLKEILKNLNEEDALLLFYPVSFKGEKLFTYEEINQLIEKYSEAPAYNIIGNGIGYGGLGGKTINHFEQGKKAGEIAKKIIDGEITSNTYIDGNSVNQYIFDYNKLKKFGIEENDLPKDSLILNKPIPFWEQYKNIIFPASLVLIGLFSIIVALIIYVINRKRYEVELVKAKQLAEDISNSKGHFISNISHELRTPVTVIMSAIQLVKLKLDKDINPKDSSINSNLNIVNQNCYRLLRLINNIIDTAKVEGGFMDFKLVNVNIVELIESIVQSAVPYAETRNLEIIFDTTDEEILMAVDPNKIDRIILNLLSNAIKFSDEGGIIEVNVFALNNKLRFSVKDRGIGIDESKINQIFEKFVQVDESFMRVNEGSGIGLSIVKSFIELHEGDIYVKSKIGEGSEFIVDLPIKIISDKSENSGKIEDEKSEVVIQTKVEFSDIYF